MIPPDTTRDIVEEELEGARAWADRHDIPLEWCPEQLEVRVVILQPKTEKKFWLKGDVEGYDVVPPAWEFCNSEWEKCSASEHFPDPSSTPFGSSIFLGRCVICAPFNRLAFEENDGPHDWGGASQWRNVADGHVQAESIGDMLQVIRRDLRHTTGTVA